MGWRIKSNRTNKKDRNEEVLRQAQDDRFLYEPLSVWLQSRRYSLEMIARKASGVVTGNWQVKFSHKYAVGSTALAGRPSITT
jgi:hypothetical protein